MPHDPEVEALADRLMPALFRAVRRLKRDAPPMTLNPIELMVLFTIHHAPGIGVAELAAREGLSSPTMSAHVKRLEAAGMITRETDATDRRRSSLALTPSAREVVDSARQRGSSVMTACLAVLSPDDREALSRAVGALERLAGDQSCVEKVS